MGMDYYIEGTKEDGLETNYYLRKRNNILRKRKRNVCERNISLRERNDILRKQKV